MNKGISIGLGALALLFVAALLQPQWNPFTVIILIGLAATSGWYSIRFWRKA